MEGNRWITERSTWSAWVARLRIRWTGFSSSLTGDPPYLANKLVGLVSTAGGVGGLQAVNTMEFVVRALRGWAVPLVIPVPRAWQAFDGQGRALDLGVGKQLRELGAEVTKAWLQFRSHGFCDYSSPKTSRRLSEEYVVYFAVWPMLVGDGYACRCQAQMA